MMINEKRSAIANSIPSMQLLRLVPKPGRNVQASSAVRVSGGAASPVAAPPPQKRGFARLALHATLAALLLWSALAGELGHAAPARAAPAGGEPAASQSWLVKWRDPAQAKPLPGTRVLRRLAQPAAAGVVDVVRPEETGADTSAWLLRLQQTPEIEYVEPLSQVELLASSSPASNDPKLPLEQHLDQIGAKEAWNTVHDQTAITIAVIDTGVDLNHPDLVDNLIPGTNLVSPGKLPEDDNGHGTSVAGVLAGEGNNRIGVAGILWHARIMPIKALDADGYGDEERLGKAIVYAVDHGARIVVLSVGLYRYSLYLKDIAAYAESKGALLVAASGNDGVTFGSRADVKFPAAYPTVVAVAGADPDGNPEPRSNTGPEIDLAAPWHVYTTAIGGGYKSEEGTSMAAPQVAAAAALVWAMHPDYKPYQVRSLLRQTALDIGEPGFDLASGYGLLQVDNAVTAMLKPDSYEPNNSKNAARVFPLGKKIAAELAGGADKDWYSVDAPYDGVVAIQLQGLIGAGDAMPTVRMTHDGDTSSQSIKDAKLGNQTMQWNVKKGRNYFELHLFDKTLSQHLPYLLTSTFEIAPDAYEINEKQYQAFTLSPRSQQITGNFHQTGDLDWYAIHFDTGGTVKLTMSVDSARIDPSVGFQRQGEAMQETDEKGDGETETTRSFNVTPGQYYIRVRNSMSAQASPTVAEYHLKLQVISKLTDPNEPNDKTYEATGVSPGSNYWGVVGTSSDVDWYQLRLASASMTTVQLSGIPSGIRMKAELYDKKQKLLTQQQSAPNQTGLTKELKLGAGVYYIKVTASASFDKQYYKLRIQTDKLVAGFRDIEGHWAVDSIEALRELGVVAGSGSFRFNPDQNITRAEAVSMLVRAVKPKAASTVGFVDVQRSHWAYGPITNAAASGWVGGYPGGFFGPNQSIDREEMAVMLLRTFGLGSVRPVHAPFLDVPADRWSAPAIQTMKQKGLLGGYENGGFKPESSASRAEFATVLLRTMHLTKT
ncbi:S8 family serine peptidase [Paenibacillus sp. OV219]|uniref:S8 family serine peptidase n=1 Tax=Paenibacillus sp. OV219 TaxID=1884377 RepID=UPI0008B25065|nr:S8 family serine peptidase [Paenibacillus sp. OV219]SEN62883.1 Serine protease, subtilisin family [Paenibacillus sp. OV219]